MADTPGTHPPEFSITARQPAASAWPWALAVILLILVSACGGVGYFLFTRAAQTTETALRTPERLLSGLAAAFRPEVNSTTVIRTAIGKISHTPKLVVLTATIDAEVEKSSATNWGYVYWGMTQVRLRAHGNRVQYYIPVEGIKETDFTYDASSRTLSLMLPPPRLDEEMVDVQSDPRQIEVETGNGWAKFDRWSGEPLRAEARQDLRKAVLSVGNHELLQAKAQANAQAEMRKLLSPLAEQLQKGVKVQMVFRREEASTQQGY